MDEMSMFEVAEAFLSAGDWRWQDDEIVWNNNNREDSIDKDMNND